MAIKVGKLTSGEYFIANAHRDAGEYYKLKDPFLFGLVPNQEEGAQPGQVGLAMSPMVPLQKPGMEIVVREDNIAFWVENPDQQLVGKYTEATSNIVIPMPKQRMGGVR